MPFAVTHVLLAIIVVDLYRDYVARHRGYFTLHTILIAGIAGLLPDLDIVMRILFKFFNLTVPGVFEHGMLTHTPIFGLVFLIPGLIYWKREQHRSAMYFFVICFGVLLHIFLDYFVGGGAGEGVMFLWPLTTTTYKLHLFSLIHLPNLAESLDAVILLAWLVHEEIKHKITDFF